LSEILDQMSYSPGNKNCRGPIAQELISSYGATGQIELALELFESTEVDCDKMCLRAILKACSQSSPPRWLEATTILHASDILEGATGPGRIDPLALGHAIVACSKAGEVDEGLNLLNLYGKPRSTRCVIGRKHLMSFSRANSSFPDMGSLHMLFRLHRSMPSLQLVVA